MKTAREAWEKVKTVDSMVTLFHCSLRHADSCDTTMLELDSALNELLSNSSETTVDEVLAAFPRLSNSCVKNEVSSGVALLGVQERWIDLLVNSETFNQRLKEKDYVPDVADDLSLFVILRAYLNNFEHVVSLKENSNTTANNLQALGRIIDGVLKLLVQVRDTEKPKKKKAGRRKKNKQVESADAEADNDGALLIWDDSTIKTLVGERTDCVWTAEQLWNIANRLLAISLTSGGSDARGIAADVLAASHDFCLLSEEEVDQPLSKGYLDYDVKFDPTKAVLPNFGDEESSERPPCDISSEVSL